MIKVHVQITRNLNLRTKSFDRYTPTWSEEIFVINKIKDTVPWKYVVNDLNGEEIIVIFHGKKLKKKRNEKIE